MKDPTHAIFLKSIKGVKYDIPMCQSHSIRPQPIRLILTLQKWWCKELCLVMDQSTIISLLTQNKISNFKGRLHCQSRYRLSCMAANPHKRGGFPFSSTSTQSSSSGGGHSAAHWRREQQTNNSCSRSDKAILIIIAIFIIIIGVRANGPEDIYIVC